MVKIVQQKQSLVKQDGNFLEYPTYTLTTKTSVKKLIIKRENGVFQLSTLNPKLPDRLDKTLLYYILEKIWKNNFKSREVKITRYRIAKDVIGGTGKNDYKRVMDGLKRWENMSVEFEGVFYEGDNYTTRLFGFLDDVIMDHKTKELTIRVNEQYLEWLQATKYYRLIDWRKFGSFNRDISAKFYEFFQLHSFPWKIETSKLVEKLTLSKADKFPSQVIKKIIPAINEINEKTTLNVKFTHYKNDTDETIFVFDSETKKSKVEKKHQLKLKLTQPEKEQQEKEFPEEINLPDERVEMLVVRGITRTTAQQLVTTYPNNIETQIDAFDWLKEKQDKRIDKNPAGYLRKAIEEDYALPKGYKSKEERQAAEIAHRKQQEEQQKERKHQQAIENLEKQVKSFIKAMSAEEQQSLRQQALETLHKKFTPEQCLSLPEFYIGSVMQDIVKKTHFKEELKSLSGTEIQS